MAETEKGIYYQTDENAAADILKDMQQMAESVDVAIEEAEEKIYNYIDTRIAKKLDKLTKAIQKIQVTTHRINVTTDIEENTEYELPCQYIVGSGDIEIFCNNEIMIRAIEGSWGNFAEVGADGSTSNKVKFGQTIEAGSVLIVKKTGVIAND